jgi:hypothetical protein
MPAFRQMLAAEILRGTQDASVTVPVHLRPIDRRRM